MNFFKKYMIISFFFLICTRLFSQPLLFDKNALVDEKGKSFFISPIKEGTYTISSKFGFRVITFENAGGSDADIHKGIDLVAKKGTRILAVADGDVVIHYPPPGGKWKGHPAYGGVVVLYHGSGIYSLYAHLSQTWVGRSQKVVQGQTVGIIGKTGKTTGIHLHFEILIDPYFLLKKNNDFAVEYLLEQQRIHEEEEKKAREIEERKKAIYIESFIRFVKPWLK